MNKRALLPVVLGMICVAKLNAATILSEDFTVDPGLTGQPTDIATGADASQGGNQLYNVTTSLGRFLGNNTSFTEGVGAAGFMSLTSTDSSGNRMRARGVVAGLNGIASGMYTASFLVSNYRNVNAADGDNIYFHVYRLSGIDSTASNWVNVDSFENTFLTQTPITKNGTADFTGLSLDNAVTGDGIFSVDFNLTSAGGADDYLFVQWVNASTNGETVDMTMPTMDVDNLLVETKVVPEPSRMALLGAALVGLGWRRRRRA